MVYVFMAYIVMVYVVMAYIVMAGAGCRQQHVVRLEVEMDDAGVMDEEQAAPSADLFLAAFSARADGERRGLDRIGGRRQKKSGAP